MSRKLVAVAAVLALVLATGSSVGAERSAKTEGVGGAVTIVGPATPGGLSILRAAEQIVSTLWQTLVGPVEPARSVGRAVEGPGGVKINPPKTEGVGGTE